MAAELADKEVEEMAETEEDDTELGLELIDGLYYMDPGPNVSKKRGRS
jgi:hypothetical protein